MSRSPAKKNVVFGITQDELETYRAVHQDAKRLTTEVDTRRKSLLARVEAGATVQPGPLLTQVSITEVRRFTADEVARILGPAVVAEIRTQLTPSVERRFSVISTEALERAG